MIQRQRVAAPGIVAALVHAPSITRERHGIRGMSLQTHVAQKVPQRVMKVVGRSGISYRLELADLQRRCFDGAFERNLDGGGAAALAAQR